MTRAASSGETALRPRPAPQPRTMAPINRPENPEDAGLAGGAGLTGGALSGGGAGTTGGGAAGLPRFRRLRKALSWTPRQSRYASRPLAVRTPLQAESSVLLSPAESRLRSRPKSVRSVSSWVLRQARYLSLSGAPPGGTTLHTCSMSACSIGVVAGRAWLPAAPHQARPPRTGKSGSTRSAPALVVRISSWPKVHHEDTKATKTICAK